MNKFKSALVAAVATGLVVSGSGVGAVAFAQDTDVNISETNVANIDKSATAKLTIHKHADTGNKDSRDNGLPNGDLDAESGLEGAQFKITPVKGYNLKRNKGWQDLAAANLDAEKLSADKLDTENAKTVRTGPNGQVTADGLPLGLYLVEEVSAPTGYNVGESKPFLVTLPMTNPNDLNKWNYDVHVYPKNKEVEDAEKPSKTVEDANTKAGDTIYYQATSPVKAYDKLTQLKIRDFYPQDRLENGKIDPRDGKGVKIVGTKNGAEATESLTQDDYTVSNDKPGQYDIILTQSGIDKLNKFEANGERKVVVDLSFTVSKVEEDVTKPIINRLGVQQNNTGTPGGDPSDPNDNPDNPDGDEPEDPYDPEDPNTPGDPDDWPQSYYGDVQITKTGEDNQELEGVTFDLYRCNSPEDLAEEKLDIGEIKTNADGVATIRGLQANNWANNKAWSPDNTDAEGDPRDYLAYCLVETKTAEGHELLAEPQKFQIEASTDNKTVELTALEIKNSPSNGGFNLPLTGGQGVLYLLAGGVLLLVLAGGATYILRRREA